MYCFQCQETMRNTACTSMGYCGKPEETANLQDLLVHVLKGVSIYAKKLKELGISDKSTGRFVNQGLFATITNANWDEARFEKLIRDALKLRGQLRNQFLAAYKDKTGRSFNEPLHDSATWTADTSAEFAGKAKSVGVLSTENEDVRSLRELLIIGLKGVGAYADHAAVLGFEKDEIYDSILEGLASTTEDRTV
ncbi:MAG: hydroxylamine reductase, partial [Acidobacteriota bacterium]